MSKTTRQSFHDELRDIKAELAEITKSMVLLVKYAGTRHKEDRKIAAQISAMERDLYDLRRRVKYLCEQSNNH